MTDKKSTGETEKSIRFIVDQVSNRGWLDIPTADDRFADLRKDRRFSEGQVTALYEQYFLPERHEFEWQVLSDIVHAIIKSPVTDYIKGAIIGGVIGNAAFDLLKRLCVYSASLFDEKFGTQAVERVGGFKQLASDAEKVRVFFNENHRARIEEVERSTGLPREKIYPLIKIAGLIHHRRIDPCFWEIPQ